VGAKARWVGESINDRTARARTCSMILIQPPGMGGRVQLVAKFQSCGQAPGGHEGDDLGSQFRGGLHGLLSQSPALACSLVFSVVEEALARSKRTAEVNRRQQPAPLTSQQSIQGLTGLQPNAKNHSPEGHLPVSPCGTAPHRLCGHYTDTAILRFASAVLSYCFYWCRKRDSNPRPHHYE
jgi:hypothetical protein